MTKPSAVEIRELMRLYPGLDYLMAETILLLTPEQVEYYLNRHNEAQEK